MDISLTACETVKGNDHIAPLIEVDGGFVSDFILRENAFRQPKKIP